MLSLSNPTHSINIPDRAGFSCLRRDIGCRTVRTVRWWVSKFYDRLMVEQEYRVFGRWRYDLLGLLDGTVVEIGAGTGRNLDKYGPRVERLVLTEPTPAMHRQLQSRVEAWEHRGKALLSYSEADDLPVGDAEADAVVSTLVLCSVDDLDAALREARRILRPGGKLVFFEHVLSEDPDRARWQRWLAGPWHFLEGSCRLDRDTPAAIERAGFTFEEFDRVVLEGMAGPFRELVKGVARV